MKLSVFALLLVTACAVDEVEIDEDEPLPVDELGELDAADLLPGCNQVTTVVLYSESTNAFTLPNAFAAAVDRCTHYYVYLPALTGDKTQVRASADKVHALGPNFHAMAEFHWAAWRDWVNASPGTRDFRSAGHVFRTRMAAAGYDAAAGDIWAINEFPSTTRTGEFNVWTHERDAVKGLAEGDGSVTARGVVFIAGMGQTLQNFSVYKPNLKNWLQQTEFWADMATSVRGFMYEVYADPHNNCVIGSNVPADRANLNAYLEHLPRLAVAGGAAAGTAAAYLKRHYIPLVQASWGSNFGFGDNRIALTEFEKFSRLQVYATHFWAAQNGYPGRRIGFAWAPKDATPEQEVALANVIAGSVGRSYPANDFFNLGKFACSIAGSLNGCGCTVSGAYNHGWDTFATW
jgi:hypothetical protein